MPRETLFRFKQFNLQQARSPLKIGTDSVLIGAWPQLDTAQHVLDIGTGTGVIALLLAQRYAHLHIDAIDLDENASAEAQENMQASPWHNRLRVFNGDILQFSAPEGRLYDAIVTNPPYFESNNVQDKQFINPAKHTATLSFEALCESMYRLLKPEGSAYLILPILESQHFITIANQHHFQLSHYTEVITKRGKTPSRCLLGFSKQATTVQRHTLILMEDDNRTPTPEYKALVGDFYTFM